MKRLFVAGLAVAMLATPGCKGGRIVPVSGVVTLNGVPYKDATVTFQPLGDSNNENPGRGSAAVTDAQGRYTLVYDGEKPGALVGRHRVQISTKFGAPAYAAPRGPGEEDAEPLPKGVDPIPAEWHDKSKVEFVVPPGGTDSANFNIETTPAKK